MTSTRPPGRIETLNGQQLYFEVHGFGEPLLLLHGFSGSSQDWIPSLEQWGTKFQLILPDLRGHGRSGILKKPFRHDDAAADVLSLLDHLGIRACTPASGSSPTAATVPSLAPVGPNSSKPLLPSCKSEVLRRRGVQPDAASQGPRYCDILQALAVALFVCIIWLRFSRHKVESLRFPGS